jgi:hypothetical protein
MVKGLMPDAPVLTWEFGGRCTAILALAYVGGFVAVVVPGGLGVREWVLDRFLAPELALEAASAAQPVTVVIVLVLRLVWTAAELVLAAVIGVIWLLSYVVPGPRRTEA